MTRPTRPNDLSVESWIRIPAGMLVGGPTRFGYGCRRNRLARREQAGPARESPEPAAAGCPHAALPFTD